MKKRKLSGKFSTVASLTAGPDRIYNSIGIERRKWLIGTKEILESLENRPFYVYAYINRDELSGLPIYSVLIIQT